MPNLYKWMDILIMQSQKRKPGRPPSDVKRNKVDRLGICETPVNESSVELFCASPQVFKKLFSLYKATNVSEITFCFDKSEIRIFAESYSEQVHFGTFIDCGRVHRYYCEKPIKLRMSRDASEKIINRIDSKFYESIWFIIKPFTNQVNSMQIILKNTQLDATSIHTLNLSTNSETLRNFEWNETVYPLSFKMKRQDLKKYISDVEGISGVLMIEWTQSQPLKFRYHSECKIVNGTEIFNNPEKINLVISPNAPVIVANTIRIGNLKPLSNAQAAEETRIFIDNNLPSMLLINMDDGITTKILIMTENLRPK